METQNLEMHYVVINKMRTVSLKQSSSLHDTWLKKNYGGALYVLLSDGVESKFAKA